MKPEGIRPNLIPHKDEEAAPELSETRELARRYAEQIKAYLANRKELLDFQKEFMSKFTDPEVRTKNDSIDMRLHDKHIALDQLGAQIGKEKVDVLTDIMRGEGKLGWDGLPEFAVLTTDDIIPFSDDFVLGDASFRPRRGELQPREMLHVGGGDTLRMKGDEVMLVYNVVPYWGNVNNNEKYSLLAPDDSIRMERGRALAETLGGRFDRFKNADGFHLHTISVQGVILPKDQLNYALGVIKSNATAYRLGELFYSEEEEQEAARAYKGYLFHTFNLLTSFREKEEGERHVRQFLAALFNVRGKRALDAGNRAYEEWRQERGR
jgi:hypothetical protein